MLKAQDKDELSIFLTKKEIDLLSCKASEADLSVNELIQTILFTCIHE